MFVETLNQVTAQTIRECQDSKYVRDYLSHAIVIWCNQLNISQDKIDYIRIGYSQPEIIDFTDYIYKQGTTEMNNWKIPTPFGEAPTSFTVKNQFYQHINDLWNRMNIRSDNIKFIVLIAFAITAIGYFIYILNQPKQQQTTRREEPETFNSNPPAPSISKVQTPPIPTPTVQKITKQFLVLVVSHSQADFLESLKAKRRIDFKDGESLYEITKYLWLGSETEYSKIEPNIGKYSVAKGAESEYDIYLVSIEINQADEGFNSNVNQLDRFDAFRNLALADLPVNLTISPRLQMEAYGNIGVYSR
ncbi:MAG: hypothetical protein I4E98_20520 [Planktothrix agardhii KL2]|jgi:hypothetical protein|uniref:hypothetical protein n=1 Tax=Planktothrix agardhii TaxID=1160 RepID=UPI001A2F9C4A|nr:hypothetical protein [Planktothrix agardhii]MBG0748944.1 hypothetical protein [Planktothrix agardhii KL2]MCF3573830.1 hypothetical protein [Planktothrix agardhii 1812]MCF3582254.1 hypothetical protein [Planktothrix agardhii 1811]